MSLFSELKRRNVFRVTAAYVVIAWLLIQVLELAADSFEAPLWVMKMIITVLIIGFIPAVLFSWAFELTPEGLKKEQAADEAQPHGQYAAKKLDVITLVALAAVVGLVVWQQTNGPTRQATQAVDVAANASDGATAAKQSAATANNDRSIAVLPFVALSTDENDSYFGKGLAEELLNALAQFPELKVAARTSAFSYGNKDVDLREVGEALGVAHVLEGSVRRSGDRIRVTAQLIRAIDGFHLWSETYERADSDIFAIQDEIVAKLSNVLQFRLGVGAGVGRAASRNVNPRAYEEYLRGLDLWWKRGVTENRILAIATLRHATELDPNFADGWSAFGASLVLSHISNVPGMTVEEFYAQAVGSLRRALELDSNNARAHAAMVFWYSNNEIDVALAARHLQQALDIARNNAFTVYAAAVYNLTVGNVSESIAFFNQSIALDPLNEVVVSNWLSVMASAGRFTEALAAHPCYESQCGKVSYRYELVAGALAAGTSDELIEQTDAFALVSTDNELPRAWFDIVLRYVDFLSGVPVDPQFWQTVDFADPWLTTNAQQIASMLAQMGEVQRALDLLFAGVEANGSVFASSDNFHALMPGRMEMPESIRRHPRYHEYWNLPGMPGLAAERRANGQLAGLPLPIEETSE